jgi:hypothetical protein
MILSMLKLPSLTQKSGMAGSDISGNVNGEEESDAVVLAILWTLK